METGRGWHSWSLVPIIPGPWDLGDASHCQDGPGRESEREAVSTGGWPLRSVSELRARRACWEGDLRPQTGRKEGIEGRKEERNEGVGRGGRRPVVILAQRNSHVIPTG